MTGSEFDRLMRGLAREIGIKGRVECMVHDGHDGCGAVIHLSSGHILAHYNIDEIVMADGPITASTMIKRMEKRMREALWQPVKCPHCWRLHEQPDALEAVESCLQRKSAGKK